MGPPQSNTDSSDLRETARKWILQSLHDKKMAEMNYQHEGYDVAAFLSHQTVEKLFMGLFVIEGDENSTNSSYRSTSKRVVGS
ncbi:HEPN domain-containing protein [uncultured Methanospirillum sp.]|uniref:HEPN domain-containing protein n=1 Tax=uncultured Methanospirillum sp. TaxID=262503 RepID=UPI0029C6CC80|nr:HEPN domain-containing protein [uncultured Methanospirillum sp.]